MNNFILKSTGKKIIRFVDSSYATQFYLEDGQNLKVNLYDDQTIVGPCKYIDPYHFEFQNSTWHIMQFAEFNEMNHNTYQPEYYLTDLNLYEKMYINKDLKDENGMILPYYFVVDRIDWDDNKGYAFALNPEAPAQFQVYFGSFNEKNEFISSYMSIYDALHEINNSELNTNPHDKRLFLAVLQEHVWNKEIPDRTQAELAPINDEEIENIAILADDALKLAKMIDPYEYMDNYETEADLFNEIVRDINNGNVSRMIDWYKEVVDDGLDDAEFAQNIIDRLKRYKPEADRHQSIAQMIVGAEARSGISNETTERFHTEKNERPYQR